MNTKIFTKSGKYLMLALDHRGSFKKLMNPTAPDSVTKAEAVELKREIITSTEAYFSGLLIDQEYGLAAYKGPEKPFLLPLEKSGYAGKDSERLTELEFSASRLKQMGAAGAKLLLYFNPHNNVADKQLAVAKAAIGDCKGSGLPLFLEIVTYQPESSELLPSLVGESVAAFLGAGLLPDVFKLEYPGSLAAAKQITGQLGSRMPWILLTRGAKFEDFTRQLQDAISGGAAGFLAGRALWQEAASLPPEGRVDFLQDILPARFQKLNQIALGL